MYSSAYSRQNLSGSCFGACFILEVYILPMLHHCVQLGVRCVGAPWNATTSPKQAHSLGHVFFSLRHASMLVTSFGRRSNVVSCPSVWCRGPHRGGLDTTVCSVRLGHCLMYGHDRPGHYRVFSTICAEVGVAVEECDVCRTGSVMCKEMA